MIPVPTEALAGAPPEIDYGGPEPAALPDQAGVPQEALGGEPMQPPPPPFAQQVATSANTLAESTPPAAKQQPGAWARALVGGVQDALAGFGAEGKVPQGAGALYGLGAGFRQQQAAVAAKQERQDKLKQQQTEDQRQQSIAAATIAHENAATMHDQMLMASLNYDNRQKNIATGKTSIAPFETAGAPIIQEGIDSDEAARLISEKKLSPSQQHAFPTGEAPVLDKDGKEQFDSSGNPVTRPTYTVIGDVPEVTLDAATAKLISENTAYKLPEGTKMSGLVYGTVIQQATSAQTAKAAIEQKLEEAGIEKANLDETSAAQKMRPDWNTALAKANGDVSKALNYLETNPQMKQKYPDAASLVANLYGGKNNFETVRHNQADEAEKRQADAEKKREDDLKAKTAGADFTGNPDAVDPGQFLASLDPNARNLVQMIGEGRAPINNPGYLLARKPELLEAVAKAYPGFDASKVKSYQDTYKDFTAGKTSVALNSAGTALLHLNELRSLNTLQSRIPGTAANKAFENKLDTVAPELARFYGNDTIPGIESYRRTMGGVLGLNRDSAILTQAKSMGDKLDNYEQEWTNAAPSKAYQAPMPGISDAAKQARAAMDPSYAARSQSGQPTNAPVTQTHVFSPQAWATANPGKDVNAAIAAAKQQGYQIQQ